MGASGEERHAVSLLLQLRLQLPRSGACRSANHYVHARPRGFGGSISSERPDPVMVARRANADLRASGRSLTVTAPAVTARVAAFAAAGARVAGVVAFVAASRPSLIASAASLFAFGPLVTARVPALATPGSNVAAPLPVVAAPVSNVTTPGSGVAAPVVTVAAPGSDVAAPVVGVTVTVSVVTVAVPIVTARVWVVTALVPPVPAARALSIRRRKSLIFFELPLASARGAATTGDLNFSGLRRARSCPLQEFTISSRGRTSRTPRR